ncbi:MAG: acylphosphatase [Acidobacteria bacterium]|nr:acylphosphatase [Acidobacteriota bacterium]
MQAKHIIVHGMVQGVGFRWFVQRIGERLGLTGNVRNLPDGTVEIIVEGSGKKIEEFMREVSRGPSMSRVERLEVQDRKPSGRFGSFLIEGW